MQRMLPWIMFTHSSISSCSLMGGCGGRGSNGGDLVRSESTTNKAVDPEHSRQGDEVKQVSSR